jgi:tripartite-type tricarboxylate transporter receptor subunit TctC
MIRCIAMLLVFFMAAVSSTAYSQTLDPDKPIRIVVPFAPGGIATALARTVAEGITQTSGRQVIVENRSGGFIAVGGEFVLRQPTDGHTLLFVGNGFSAIHHYNPEIPFDSHREFIPISILVETPAAMLVSNNLPIGSAADLIREMRQTSDKYTFGTTGGGGIGAMAPELMVRNLNSRLINVAYRGQGQALIDVQAGRLDMVFDLLTGVLNMSRSGQGRLMMVTSRDRHPSAPDTPSWGELGINDQFMAWQALFVRSSTPQPIREELNALIRRSLQTEFVQTRFREAGFHESDILTGLDLRGTEERISRENERWSAHFSR